MRSNPNAGSTDRTDATPLVTIGIPTYNRLPFLKEAVASALAQTYPRIEIVISQNPHADPEITAAIATWCKEAAQTWSNVRYVVNEHNIGAVANFNRLADVAHGAYILFIGDDDRLLPHTVERLVSQVRAGVDVVFSNLYLIAQDGSRLTRESEECTVRYKRSELEPGELTPMQAQITAWHVGIPIFASLMRTQTFLQHRFREDLLLTDTEFYIRLAHAGARFVFIPDYLTEIRYHRNRISSSMTHFEKLAVALSAVRVPPDVAPHKQAAMRVLTSTAVTNYLLHGHERKARALYYSEYLLREYRRTLKGRIQALCLALPPPAGNWLYRLLHVLHNPKYYLRRSERWGQEALPSRASRSPAKTEVLAA